MKIREAVINDIPKLVVLVDQLGYPTSINKIKVDLMLLHPMRAIIL